MGSAVVGRRPGPRGGLWWIVGPLLRVLCAVYGLCGLISRRVVETHGLGAAVHVVRKMELNAMSELILH